MAEPPLDRPLVEVLAMGAPDALPAQEAKEEREARIGEVIERQEQCCSPKPPARELEEQPSEEIAERDAPHVAHEDTGGLPVPVEKAEGRRRRGEAVKRQRATLTGESGDECRADAEARGLASGDPVDPVHEVEEVEKPKPEKAGGETVEPEGEEALENGPGVPERQHADGNRGDMHEEGERHGQGGELVAAVQRGDADGGTVWPLAAALVLAAVSKSAI